MKIDTTAPLDQDALQAAREVLTTLQADYQLREGEHYYRIPLHWAVEDYGCVDGHYNGEVVLEQGAWRLVLNGDARRNATYPASGDYAEHTAGENGNSFGIAITGLVGATPADLGAEPPQKRQEEFLSAYAGAVALAYDIDCLGFTQRVGEQQIANVATHAEYAIRDGYFPGDPAVPDKPLSGPPYRWDLAEDESGEITNPGARAAGNVLRKRAHQYKLALQAEESAK